MTVRSCAGNIICTTFSEEISSNGCWAISSTPVLSNSILRMSGATNCSATYSWTVYTEHMGSVCSVSLVNEVPKTLKHGDVVNGSTKSS